MRTSGHLRAKTTRTSRVWWSLHVYIGVRRRFRCCFTRRFRTGRPMARLWENTVDETIRRSAWVLRRKTKGNNIPACTCVLKRIHMSVRTNVYKKRCRRFTRPIRRRVCPPPRFKQTFPNTMGRERRAATTPTRYVGYRGIREFFHGTSLFARSTLTVVRKIFPNEYDESRRTAAHRQCRVTRCGRSCRADEVLTDPKRLEGVGEGGE